MILFLCTLQSNLLSVLYESNFIVISGSHLFTCFYTSLMQIQFSYCIWFFFKLQCLVAKFSCETFLSTAHGATEQQRKCARGTTMLTGTRLPSVGFMTTILMAVHGMLTNVPLHMESLSWDLELTPDSYIHLCLLWCVLLYDIYFGIHLQLICTQNIIYDIIQYVQSDICLGRKKSQIV